MTEKKTQAHGSSLPADEGSQTKTQKSTPAPKKAATSQKGCMDRWVENPGFPWMVIAILFTLLVIMFWKDHYAYWMWKKHNGGMYNKEWRMDGERYRPMMNRGERVETPYDQVAPSTGQ